MSRNLELKARVSDAAAARLVAARLSGGPPEVLHQQDTYFHCPHGRLKLREIRGQPSQLIWYQRPDERAPRTSEYQIVPVTDAVALRGALGAAVGIRVVVAKTRELSWHRNVRIHIDQVQGLGSFLEFEAVLTSDEEALHAESQLRELMASFDIPAGELIARSYCDLLHDISG